MVRNSSLSELEWVRVHLPDLDRVDFHGGVVAIWVVPSWVPCAIRVPESVDRVWVSIAPGLTALSVWEVAIGTTSSDVHDKEELLVEWCVDLLLVGPRVVSVGPATLLPEAL